METNKALIVFNQRALALNLSDPYSTRATEDSRRHRYSRAVDMAQTCVAVSYMLPMTPRWADCGTIE